MWTYRRIREENGMIIVLDANRLNHFLGKHAKYSQVSSFSIGRFAAIICHMTGLRIKYFGIFDYSLDKRGSLQSSL